MGSNRLFRISLPSPPSRRGIPAPRGEVAFHISEASRPRVAVLYHYFYPDDVVSARHYGDLCQGLAERGWRVESWPCNRGCRDESVTYPLRDDWEGIAIRRVWRPGLRQASGVGRVVNAAWMLASWCRRAVFLDRPPDVLVIGTDPILSVLTALVVRKLRPAVKIAHWCFDLYPEGLIADGMLREDGCAVRVIRRLLKSAYRSCDLMVDLGGCMRDRLEPYGHAGRKATLVPWALAEPAEVEPADPEARRELFGDGRLGLLYSGNFGRAHSFAEILGLARRLRGDGVRFCFGVRGNRAEELRAAVRPDDRNVSLAPFAPEATLTRRLTAADIHLVSLRKEWTGSVVPSKFFGALAAGRPVIFAGGRDAAIARWIAEHKVGWVLDDRSEEATAAELRRLAAEPERLAALQEHCHRVYQRHFCRQHTLDAWDRELREMLPGAGARRSRRGASFAALNGIGRGYP
jgi:glycosyltransferase involved in cell wall biosynthesis